MYATYLANGLRTISVLPYTVVACVAATDTPAAAGFGLLRPAITRAARCFRLANDLGSEARERAEGKLNAVTLLASRLVASGVPADSAAATARRMIRVACDTDLAWLYAARRTVAPPLPAMAGFLCDHAAFVCDLYEFGDYDILSRQLRTPAP
jgi:hypothetical protein